MCRVKNPVRVRLRCGEKNRGWAGPGEGQWGRPYMTLQTCVVCRPFAHSHFDAFLCTAADTSLAMSNPSERADSLN